MILVDSNILMYAAGAEHPNKAPALRFLERAAAGEMEAVIDAEVLQELMHRYASLHRWSQGRLVYQHVRALFPEVLPITAEVMDHAKELMDRLPSLTARDAVHAAVCAVYQLEGICTFDQDFDRIPGCVRRLPK